MTSLEHIVKLAVFPTAQPVESREREAWCRSSLASYQLGPATHIVHHPSRQTQVVGVPCDLADVQGKRSNQIGDIRRTRLDHQVGRIHGAPKFGFDHLASQ